MCVNIDIEVNPGQQDLLKGALAFVKSDPQWNNVEILGPTKYWLELSSLFWAFWPLHGTEDWVSCLVLCLWFQGCWRATKISTCLSAQWLLVFPVAFPSSSSIFQPGVEDENEFPPCTAPLMLSVPSQALWLPCPPGSPGCWRKFHILCFSGLNLLSLTQTRAIQEHEVENGFWWCRCVGWLGFCAL